MALSIVGATVGTQSASGSPVTVNKPTGTANGDFIVAAHLQDVFGTLAGMTGATGFTQQGSSYSGTGSNFGKVFKRAADGTEGSSFSFGQNDTSVVLMITFRGHDTTTPFDVDPTWSQGSSGQTLHIAPSITTVATNTGLCCVFSTTSDLNTASYLPPASPAMTEQGDAWAQFTVAELATQILSSSGSTGTRTATFISASNNEYTTLSFAIKEASGVAAASLVMFDQQQLDALMQV